MTWDEWSFSLLPLDNDIISMELPEFFRDYFLVSIIFGKAIYAGFDACLGRCLLPHQYLGGCVGEEEISGFPRVSHSKMAVFHLLLQEADQRWISTVAQALQLMNSLFGPFTKTYGIGRCAKVRPGQPRRVGLFRDHVPQRKKWL